MHKPYKIPRSIPCLIPHLSQILILLLVQVLDQAMIEIPAHSLSMSRHIDERQTVISNIAACGGY